MLAAKNEGMAEAVEVIKRMSLVKAMRCRYEAHLKAVRGRRVFRSLKINWRRTEFMTIRAAERLLYEKRIALLYCCAYNM